MKRSTPLRRLTPLRGGGPLRRRSSRSGWRKARAACFDRARGMCQAQIARAACTGRAEHAHHRLMRSAGGGDELSNLLAVCGRCHDFIHLNPEWSYDRGFLRRAHGGAA